MLIFDSELFCIPADEADVVELYRSPDAVSFSAEDAALPSGLAIVCVLKRDGGYQVFVAFHLKDIKRSLVYAVDPAAGGQPSYDAPLKKAFSFTEMMGFTMEAVNLKYGTAMREVVLRAVPALLSRENVDRLRRERNSELAELEQLVAGQTAEDRDPTDDSGLSPDRQVELKRAREKRDEATKAAAKKLALEKRHTEQTEAFRGAIDKFLAQVNADELADVERVQRERLMVENSAMKARTGELEQTVCRLEGQLDASRAEADKRIAELEKALQKAEERVKSGQAELNQSEKIRALAEKRIVEAEQAASEAGQEIESECARREQLVKEKVAAEKRTAELEDALRATRQELEAERTEKERIATERTAAEKRNKELAEAARVAQQQTEIRQAAQEEVAAVRSETEKRIGELELAVHEAQELIESERFERELLVREKTAAEKRIAELESNIRKAGTPTEPEPIAQERFDAARAETEKRIRQLEKAAELAREQAEKEGAERELLAKEQASAKGRVAELEKLLREAELRAAELPPTASSQGEEAGKQVAELKEALQKSEGRTELLRLEIERIAAAKAALETRLAELEATGGGAARKEPEGNRGPLAAAANRTPSQAQSLDRGDPHVVRRPPPKGAFFHVDWDLTRIDYASPEDILEVYQSMNLVQLSLEGYPSQHCSAHIVAMKKGKSRQVHIAFGLSESGRALIYSPAKPIKNKADYARAISEAVKFVEVVGYMPEKMSLGKSPQALSRDLSGIPVLSGPQKQALGF